MSLSMNVNTVDAQFDIEFDKKVLFDMNTERNRKRVSQMQKRKAVLSETDSPPLVNTAQTTPPRIEELTTPFNQEVLVKETSNINPNTHNIIEEKETNDYDIELNVSNLDCSVEIHDDNDNKENISINTKQNINPNSSINFIKHSLGSSSKSFIHLNNNLIAKAAANNEKCTSSYMLALCPELFSNTSKIYYGSQGNRTNYDVDDIIKEEVEIDSPPKKHRFLSGGKVKPYIPYDKKKSNTECNRTKKIKKIKNNLTTSNKIKKIPIHNKSSSCTFNEKAEKKIIENPIKIKHYRQESMFLTPKNKINTSANVKKPFHNRSQTSMTSPNMIKVSLTKKIPINIKGRKKPQRQSCDFQAKKLFFPQKNNTLIYPNQTEVNSIDKNSTLIFTQHSNTSINASNKPQIIASMQRLKFSPISSYSNALNALNKSKKDLFCILICNDIKTNHFIFRGLYEIHQNENGSNTIGIKIFSNSFCSNKVYFKDIKNFYSFHPQGQFFFTKYKPENKHFDTNMVLMK